MFDMRIERRRVEIMPVFAFFANEQAEDLFRRAFVVAGKGINDFSQDVEDGGTDLRSGVQVEAEDRLQGFHTFHVGRQAGQ